MALSKIKTPLLAVVVALMARLTSGAPSIPMDLCANINTATSDPTFDTWQSDGLCHDTCKGFSFAIVKGNNCWCSNVEPAKSTLSDVSECSDSCPGFPDDTCGGNGLWGYMALGKSPTSTKGAGSSSPTTTGRPKEVTTTVLGTVTVAPSTIDETKTTPPTSSTSTSTSTTLITSTTTTAPDPPTDEPITSVQTVTAGGATQVQTITVAPTASQGTDPTDSADAQGVPEKEKSGIPTGTAVGIAVGVLGFVAILGAIGVLLWMRRRRRQQEAMVERSNSGRGSSAGMMSTPRTEMASIWDSEQLSGNRRNSRIMPHDPRMDPFAGNLYTRENKSRESINTIQDNHDYSRKVLRTTNPDPDDD